MKKHHILTLITASALLSSCQQHCNDEFVCETYVHRYGVPLAPQDWTDRGQDGQVISTRKDGVVVTTTYEAGLLEGETTYTFPHRDTIAKRCIYLHGHLIQEIDYYSNGVPQKQITYDFPVESVVNWYENGAPQSKEKYVQGLLIEGEYLNLEQQTESSVADQNGKRTLYNSYGQLVSIDEIQDGQMVVRRTYHANGTPASFTPYVNGCIEGERLTFAMGGEPATVENWSNNLQHGNTEIFENGEKIADQPYYCGQLHGIERRYREGHYLVQENRWEQGQKHGACHNHFNEKTQTEWFFRGRQVNRGTYEALCNQG